MSRREGSRARELTREDVIDAAAALVAEHGYPGLTMRALAERCGVPTMTLYRHVRDKEELLGALADRVLGRLQLPEPGTLSWQDELTAVFRSVHDLLLAHPDIALIAGRQPVAGQAAYRGAEIVLNALRRGGIDGEAAASAFATLFAFTLGFVQQQLMSLGPGQPGPQPGGPRATAARRLRRPQPPRRGLPAAQYRPALRGRAQPDHLRPGEQNPDLTSGASRR